MDAKEDVTSKQDGDRRIQVTPPAPASPRAIAPPANSTSTVRNKFSSFAEKELNIDERLPVEHLPLDALTCILGLLALDEVFSLLTTCKALFEASKSEKLEAFYRHRLMCIAADVFFSARAQNVPLMCTKWRQALLRVWKIDSLQWGNVTPSDKAVLSSVPK